MTDGNRRTLYRVLERQDIYDGMVRVMAAAERGNPDEGDRECLYGVVNGLVELAGSHGFSGNIWHSYLAYELASHENAFSMSEERCRAASMPLPAMILGFLSKCLTIRRNGLMRHFIRI